MRRATSACNVLMMISDVRNADEALGQIPLRTWRQRSLGLLLERSHALRTPRKLAPSFSRDPRQPRRGAPALSPISASRGLHLDLMDGHFVPNSRSGPDRRGAAARGLKLFFDTH